MTPKNILFGFFTVLILMFGFYLLNQPPTLAKTQAALNEDYVLDESTGITDFTVSFENESISSVALQPTPINVEEQKDEPVLRVEKIAATNLDGFKHIYSGIFYKKSGSVAIVRVDLNNPDVRFFVNPSNGTMTVCNYIRKYGLSLATNGSGFNMNTGIPGPFAMSNGEIYSSDRKSGISLFITGDNHVIFAPDNQIPNNAKFAVSGFNRIVQNGQMLDQFHPGHQGYKAGYGYLKRRTSIGISGSWLNVVLFDSPITITDEGQYHLDAFPGTEHVYNMDGGGSTNACTADYGSLVSETGRPVANIFGIYSSPVK